MESIVFDLDYDIISDSFFLILTDLNLIYQELPLPISAIYINLNKFDVLELKKIITYFMEKYNSYQLKNFDLILKGINKLDLNTLNTLKNNFIIKEAKS